MTNVIGLDLSLGCVGICLPDGTTEHVVGLDAKKDDLYDRARYLRDELAPWLLPADLVVIEAIGTRFVQTAIGMGYLHCLVDGMLDGTRVVKIAPGELKKWATGKGTADKHAMTVAAIRNGWACDGDEGTTDDEADAWWLWTIGKAFEDVDWVVTPTNYRVELLAKWREAAA